MTELVIVVFIAGVFLLDLRFAQKNQRLDDLNQGLRRPNKASDRSARTTRVQN